MLFWIEPSETLSQNESFDPQVILSHAFLSEQWVRQCTLVPFKKHPLVDALGTYYRVSESLRREVYLIRSRHRCHQFQPQVGEESNIKKERQKAFLKVI